MNQTKFSVVIPTCQRNDLLSSCLDAISAALNAVPCRDVVEVIVTDDGPTNNAEKVVRESYSWATHVPGPKRGPAANRNNGARHARGEWIVFVDDDCIPDRRWLVGLIRAIGPEIEVMEGRTICPGKRDTPFEEHVENLEGGVYWSCNLAIRRAAFEQLGGFDEEFMAAGGEDMEFAWRLKQAKLRTKFSPEFLVVHPPRPVSWRKIWWRTLMIKWMLLYGHKTGAAVPLSASPLRAMIAAGAGHIERLVRLTILQFRAGREEGWRRKAFWLVWDWSTSPFIVPYLMVWELRFRNMLTGRTNRASLSSAGNRC